MSNGTITTGQTIRVFDSLGIAGGGEVLAVDFDFVTVAQKYTQRHNGRVIAQGARPMRYSLATHTFEIV